jgi:hypothetical protein
MQFTQDKALTAIIPGALSDTARNGSFRRKKGLVNDRFSAELKADGKRLEYPGE